MMMFLKGELDSASNPAGDNFSRIRKRAGNYVFKEGEGIYKKGSPLRLVPEKRDRPGIISSCHEECGHFGVKKVENWLCARFTWANLRQDITEHLANCTDCRKIKAKFAADPMLHSIPVGPKAWHTIGIDFAGPFVKSEKGNKYLIVAIDYLTKWVEAMPAPDCTSETAATFIGGLLDRFGCMAVVRTDQGRHFQGAFDKLLQDNLIEHHRSRAYYPQAYGQAERTVRTIGEALKSPQGQMENRP